MAKPANWDTMSLDDKIKWGKANAEPVTPQFDTQGQADFNAGFSGSVPAARKETAKRMVKEGN